jgi:hypothetical protein
MSDTSSKGRLLRLALDADRGAEGEFCGGNYDKAEQFK